jgi:hypothetical protein
LRKRGIGRQTQNREEQKSGFHEFASGKNLNGKTTDERT